MSCYFKNHHHSIIIRQNVGVYLGDTNRPNDTEQKHMILSQSLKNKIKMIDYLTLNT